MPPPLKLPNLFASIPTADKTKLSGYVPYALHTYLTKQVLPYHYTANNIITFFLQKFADALKTSSLPPYFDETNEPRAAEILLRLNFNEPKPDPERRAPTGRTTSRPATSKKQPGLKNNGTGRTTKGRAGTSHDGHAAADAIGETESRK